MSASTPQPSEAPRPPQQPPSHAHGAVYEQMSAQVDAVLAQSAARASHTTAALSSRTAALAAQLAASQRIMREIEAALAQENSKASVTGAAINRRQGASSEPYAYTPNPSTAHVFLRPPAGTATSSSPHAAALPSSMQPLAARPAPSPLGSPLAARFSAAAASPSYDPTAYSAASARVYGGSSLPTCSPLASPPAIQSSPNAGMFSHGLLVDGAPDISDSFQARMGRAMAEQRADAMRGEQTQRQHNHMQGAAATLPSHQQPSLQQQLRAIASSPQQSPRPQPSLASTLHSSPMPSSHSLASTIAAAPSSYRHLASSPPGLSMAHLQSSPAAPAGSHGSASASFASFAASGVGGGADGHSSTLVRGLEGLTSNLLNFQHEMLMQQTRAARAREAALDELDESQGLLHDSLQLESVESGITRWEAHYSTPWNDQLTQVEEAVAALHRRMDALEAAHDQQRAEHAAAFKKREEECSASVAEQHAYYDEHVIAPQSAFHTRLLLKVDRLSQQLQTLYNRSHSELVASSQHMDADVHALSQMRLAQAAALEQEIVREVTQIREEAYAEAQEREQADAQLVHALKDATSRLQRGIQMLHD